MFTGIVEEIGRVRSLQGNRLTISATEVLKGTRTGDSIAVNGACLTATEIADGVFVVEIMPETLRRTDLGKVRAGDEVNLERSLGVGGRFGGHFVQGHVDGIGEVISTVPEDEAVLLRIRATNDIMRYIVEKGFVAVDGVSLTVTSENAASFEVSLVRYTQQHTILGDKRAGDPVNLEVDILAKYVERLWGGRREKDVSKINSDFLAEHGFLTG